MAIKILIATFGFYPQPHGVAQVAYRQALGLHQLGYQVTVITKGYSNSDFPFEVVFVNQKTDYQLFLKSSYFDVIFLHGWHNWVSDWAIPVFPLSAKTVLISHGTNFNVCLKGWRGALWWLRNRLEAVQFPKKMKQFNHFVFLSNTPDRKRMSDVVLAKKWNMHNYSIIPNGARPDFKPLISNHFREINNILPTKILLCVANFQHAKGQGELLDWFIDLALPDTALVLIGSQFNAFSDRLQKQAKNHLQTTVFLFEKLESHELLAAYSAADVFVSATYTEVQPLVLLDAMAVGLPFLCRKVGAVPDLEGGICFTTQGEFKQDIQLLLKSPVLRKSLGERGKKAIEETYNWKKNAYQYHQLIQNLLKSK